MPATIQHIYGLTFKHIPVFAAFIRDKHLESFNGHMLQFAHEGKYQLPAEAAQKGAAEFYLEKNYHFINALAGAEKTQVTPEVLKHLLANFNPLITSDEINISSIAALRYVYKKTLLQYVTKFTQDVETAVALINEIHTLVFMLDEAGINRYTANLTQKLKKSERLYKQTEAIAKMGNWTWDISTGNLEWTDELYHIYGLDENEKITLETFRQFIHPDDKERVEHGLENIEKENKQDYTFRIITRQGREKYIRSISKTIFKKNIPVLIIGTEQDVTEQYKMMQRLKESENHYKQAQHFAKVGNWEWHVPSGNVKWSDEIYNIFEVDDKQAPVTFDIYASYMHPDDKAAMTIRINEAVDAGKDFELTHRIITAKNNTKVVLILSYLQKDANGVITDIIGTAQDITEQHNILQRLQQSEHLYKQAQHLAKIGNWTWHVKQNKMQWSDELYNIYGIEEAEQISYEKYLMHIHADDRSVVEAHILNALQKKQPYEFMHRIVTQDEIIKTVSSYGYPEMDVNGNVITVFGTMQDVTQQHKIEEELRNSINFVEKIAETSPTILYVLDLTENQLLYINKEVEEVLGYTPEEMTAMPAFSFLKMIHAQDLLKQPTRQTLHANTPDEITIQQAERRFKTKSGNWKWLLTRDVVFKKDEHGKPTQLLGSALDVTERLEMEKDLSQKNILLQQSNTSLQEFAYVASHDLQEPLRKISIFGDKILNTNNDNLTDDGKLYLSRMIDASNRMQNMINDLLSVSLISTQKNYETYSLQTILSEVLQTLEYKIETTGANIHADPLPEARVNVSQFRQLFQNLLSNSIKFSKAGLSPQINITCSLLTQAQVSTFNLEKAPQYIELEFSDNGIGFEEEYSNKIFNIFQRLHGRSEYEGSGIGLAICKKIIENHGGVIYAQSVPGQGATFTVVLPQF